MQLTTWHNDAAAACRQLSLDSYVPPAPGVRRLLALVHNSMYLVHSLVPTTTLLCCSMSLASVMAAAKPTQRRGSRQPTGMHQPALCISRSSLLPMHGASSAHYCRSCSLVFVLLWLFAVLQLTRRTTVTTLCVTQASITGLARDVCLLGRQLPASNLHTEAQP